MPPAGAGCATGAAAWEGRAGTEPTARPRHRGLAGLADFAAQARAETVRGVRNGGKTCPRHAADGRWFQAARHVQAGNGSEAATGPHGRATAARPPAVGRPHARRAPWLVRGTRGWPGRRTFVAMWQKAWKASERSNKAGTARRRLALRTGCVDPPGPLKPHGHRRRSRHANRQAHARTCGPGGTRRGKRLRRRPPAVRACVPSPRAPLRPWLAGARGAPWPSGKSVDSASEEWWGSSKPRAGSCTAQARILGADDCTLPKIVAKATPAASRRGASRTMPMGMAVPDGSNTYQRSRGRPPRRRGNRAAPARDRRRSRRRSRCGPGCSARGIAAHPDALHESVDGRGGGVGGIGAEGDVAAHPIADGLHAAVALPQVAEFAHGQRA
ncbi:hypothetical protein C8F00_2031 [Xanthomonas vasicola]